jgi:hypothetical protein
MGSISVEKLKEKIASAAFTEDIKQKMADSIKYLGPNSLKFLNSHFSKSGIITSDVPVLEIIFTTQALMKSFQEGSSSEVEEFLKESPQNPDYEFGQYIIPFARDLRQYLHSHEGGLDLWDALNNFEVQVFRWLPEGELEEIVRNNLLYFVRHLPSLVMEFKRVYWLIELSDDGSWSQAMRAALEDNAEMMGKTGITRDGKNYQPTVANWLKDYLAYLPKAITNRVAFDQIQYIERAPNVQRLTQSERKALLEIIKLQAWLMNLQVTEDEIEAYEKDLLKQKSEIPSAVIQRIFPPPPAATRDISYKKMTIADVSLQGGSANANKNPLAPAVNLPQRQAPIVPFPPQPPVIDPVQLQIERRKKQQEQIDQKLQELEKKAVNKKE